MANILIIDDDEMLLAMLSKLLQLSGHSVTVTADGPRGIELCKEHTPDLVLLDLGLPTVSGLEVLKVLRRANDTVRIVMMSGYVSPEALHDAQDAGAAAFIDKSGDIQTLLHTVETIVASPSDDYAKSAQQHAPTPGHGRTVLGEQSGTFSSRQTPLRLAVGTWSWGEDGWGYGVTHTERDVVEAFTMCAEAGVTLFDTAESYGNGESERILGRCIQSVNVPVRIATKFSAGRWQIRRKDVIEACRRSLQRLRVRQVDLYQIHWPTRLASIEQRMDALAEILELGMAKRVGVSNYSLDEIRRAEDRLARRNLHLSTVQLEYNLLHVQPERNGILRHCLENDIEFLAYSPLAMGMLSGKYSQAAPPPGPRGLRYPQRILAGLHNLVDLLNRIGMKHGCTASQVALNWVLSKKALPVVGIKNRHQAEEDLSVVDWKLTDEEIEELDAFDRSWLN